jgi:flagellar basal body-associated protein FliL
MQPETPRSRSQGKHFVSLAFAFLLAAVPSGLSIACNPASGGHSGSESEAGTLPLETFVLNLSDPGQRSYLRVGIDLGLGRPLAKGEAPPLGPVRDTIIGVLGQAKADDLTSAAGKAKLKQDLLRALQQRVPDLGVVEIYFTEFLIQR